MLAALILVGVPLGVFLAARRYGPSHGLPSPALVVRHLRTQLRRRGATDIQCSWTRLSGESFQASCSGQGSTAGSSSTLYEFGTIVGRREK
jgi:hypothetical protein